MVRITSVIPLGLFAALAAASPLQFSTRSDFDVKSAAISYVSKQWGCSSREVYFQSTSTTSDGADALLRQKTNDQPVWNSYADVKFDNDNRVVHFNQKHFSISYVEVNMPNILVEAAVAAGEKTLDAKWTDTDWQYTEPDHLGYIAIGNRAKYDYILHFQGNQDAVAYTAYISALDAVVDWVVETKTGKTIFERTSV